MTPWERADRDSTNRPGAGGPFGGRQNRDLTHRPGTVTGKVPSPGLFWILDQRTVTPAAGRGSTGDRPHTEATVTGPASGLVGTIAPTAKSRARSSAGSAKHSHRQLPKRQGHTGDTFKTATMSAGRSFCRQRLPRQHEFMTGPLQPHSGRQGPPFGGTARVIPGR